MSLIKRKNATIAKRLLHSAASVGANINEATYENNKADFISKLHILLSCRRNKANADRFLQNREGEYEIMLYHGSITSDVHEIRANSVLHGTTDEKVVYLTDSRTYALLYIWDAHHNLKRGKHVTAWVKDGIVFYEEQFPEQIKAFYDNVQGYVYCVNKSNSFYPVGNREAMWYSAAPTTVNSTEHILNVYDELCKCESEGKLKVIRFKDVDKKRIEALYNHIADNIKNKGLLDLPNNCDALFYQKYFPDVWKMANGKYK